MDAWVRSISVIFAMVLSAIVVAALSYFLTPMLARRTSEWGVIDLPNERSLHSVPTPRGGGAVIAGIVLLGLALISGAGGAFFGRPILTYFFVSGGVALFGWLDDRRPLSWRFRFALQAVAAGLIVAGLGFFREADIPFIGVVHFGWFGLLLTILWIIGLCNAYNFMDGIDGLAAGQAVLAGLLWAVLALHDDIPLVAVLGILLAATSLGFLFHNWSPATIFMGDVGSAFLGISFAILPLLAYSRTGNARYPVVGLLFVGIFVFDTAVTLLRRAWGREDVFAAHRCHLYQRLVTSGYSHQTVAILFLLFAGIVGIGGLVFAIANEPIKSAAAGSVALLTLLLAVIVLVAERRVDRSATRV